MARRMLSLIALTLAALALVQPGACARHLAEAPSSASLIDYLKAQPSLTNFTAAMQNTGLADELQAAGLPVTVFASVDSAWATLAQELNTTTDVLLQNGTFLTGLLEYQIIPAASQAQLEQALGQSIETLLDGETIAPAMAVTGAVATQSLSSGAQAPAAQGTLVLVGANSDASLLQPEQAVGQSFVALVDTVLLPAIEIIEVVGDY